MNKLVLLNFLTMRNSINGLQQSPESSTSFFWVISNYKGDSSASSHFSQGVSVVVATLLKTRILWAMERALGLEYLLFRQDDQNSDSWSPSEFQVGAASHL